MRDTEGAKGSGLNSKIAASGNSQPAEVLPKLHLVEGRAAGLIRCSAASRDRAARHYPKLPFNSVAKQPATTAAGRTDLPGSSNFASTSITGVIWLKATPPYGEVFLRRLRSMGIRDRPTSPRSPWQNAYAEGLIGSIRRECLDHVVVFGERHLRHVRLSCVKYHNEVRTHLSLKKDAPVSRHVERAGRILCCPVLGGLHHQDVRI